MIREQLLELLAYKEGWDISADELASVAWETENVDGVIFYSNYKADRFTARHETWVNDALNYVCDNFGDAEHYVKMKADCNDRFLVVAFIYATERYLYDQLGIDRDEGDLSKKRIREIIRQIKNTEYEGDIGERK